MHSPFVCSFSCSVFMVDNLGMYSSKGSEVESFLKVSLLGFSNPKDKRAGSIKRTIILKDHSNHRRNVF